MSDHMQWFLVGVVAVPACVASFLAGLVVALLTHGHTDLTSQQSALMATAMLTTGMVGILLGVVIAIKAGLTEGKS